MKTYCLRAIIAISSTGLLIGCSGSDDKMTAADGSEVVTTTTQPSAPAASQPGTAGAGQQHGSSGTGKVVKAIHAGGYTYMQLENDGKQFWIAATMLKIKPGENVDWSNAALMKNFKSSSLHRTFDEILFVSSISKK